MAQPNTDPIYTKTPIIDGVLLTTAALLDYAGTSPFNRKVFKADATNGSFLQRLRFKARGTVAATVARIYIGNGFPNTNFGSLPSTPIGTPSASGGSVLIGSYYAKIVAINAAGQQTVVSGESSAATTTTNASSIAWAWTASPGAVSYRLFVSNVAGGQGFYFTTATNSYNQTTMPEVGGTVGDWASGNLRFFAELTLSGLTASANTSTYDAEMPMNLSLPPGYEVYVGLATTVANGWDVTAVGGSY